MSLVFRKVKINNNEGSIKAFVDITLNETIKLNGFRVLEGKQGLWVSPPTVTSVYSGKTHYFPIFEFEKKEHNEALAQDIIAQYKKVKAGEKIEEPTVEPAY